MGYLSCNAESAISTCDSYNYTRRKLHPHKTFKITKFSFSDLHSATNGFSQETLLGKGSHGYVYKALLHHPIKLTAAVKRTKLAEPNCATSTAENEIEILSRLRHPRLVNLLGYAAESSRGNKLIVVEYMPNGSLYDLLHCSSTRPPGWFRRVRFALQIARAVQFLHSSNPPVIHRDVKSSNVLIDADFNARLGDFGLALRGHVEDVLVKCTPPAGTLGYLDPGYLAPSDLSTKSDVFSFGILLLEIISGRNAIDVNYSPPSVVDWAVPAIKSGNFEGICDPRIGPPDDETVLRQLAVLAARCVRKTSVKRPAMAEVVECLKVVYKRVNSPIWNNLGRRVGSIGTSSRVVKYEPLDESIEMIKISRVGSRRNRKVSSVTNAEAGIDVIGEKNSDRVGRSKSIGSATEMQYKPLDASYNIARSGVGRRKVGLSVRMPSVRLRKSRSMGMLQGSRSMHKNSNEGATKSVKNPSPKELEESKLLAVDSGKETQRADT